MSLFWNEEACDDYGVTVEHYPPYVMPKKKRTKADVIGKTRTIYIDDDAYENVEQSYDVYVHRDGQTLSQLMGKISEWLLSPADYCKLTDSYNPDTFRWAVYNGPMSVKSVFNKFGRGTLVFDCDPRRFFYTGQTEINCTSGKTLRNPTKFTALPIIKIKTAAGNCTVSVGNVGINIPAVNSTTTFIINSETGQITDSNGLNLSDTMQLSRFPTLKAGNTVVSCSGLGSGDTVKIIPNWYTL